MSVDPVIDAIISQRLQQSSQRTASTAALPTITGGSSFYDQQTPPSDIMVGPGGADISVQDQILGPDDEFLLGQTPKSPAQLTAESGILNEGLPTDLRAQLSLTSLFDEELNKKNIEFNLQRYFKNQGLIYDGYDFGLRIGPVSGRLEFKDPRFEGKFNVTDPFATLQNFADLPGDIADISADTLLPIAAEVTAGVGAAFIPGVGQTGLPSIIAASAAAGTSSLARLLIAKQQGFLPDEITIDDIISQSLQEAGWSAGFGIGGAAAFKIFKPILRSVGLAGPKFDFDIDEATFLKAYEKYINSPAGKKAAEKGITPSSAQVLEVASRDAGAAEAGAMQAAATELAEREARIATSSSRETAEGLLTPSRTAALTAEKSVKEATQEAPMPIGVEGQAARMGEAERSALGQNIQELASTQSQVQTDQLRNAVDIELANADKAISDAVNLPTTVADPSNIGKAAQDAIADSYENASAQIGKQYEDLFKRWSDS